MILAGCSPGGRQLLNRTTNFGRRELSGLRQVWVVYPRQAWVYVYTSTRPVRVLAPGVELDGEDVLPGLRISVKDLFDKAGERG